MSSLTTCNFCNLQAIKREALKKEKRVTIIPSTGKLGGFEIYMHPHSVKIKEWTKDEAKRFWVAWMMEIPDHCIC